MSRLSTLRAALLDFCNSDLNGACYNYCNERLVGVCGMTSHDPENVSNTMEVQGLMSRTFLTCLLAGYGKCSSSMRCVLPPHLLSLLDYLPRGLPGSVLLPT